MKKKSVKRAAAKADDSDAGQTPERIRRRLILGLAAVGFLISILIAGLMAWALFRGT